MNMKMNMKNVRDSRSRREIFAARMTVVALLTCLFTVVPGLVLPTYPIAYASNPTVWSLVWSDEFDGPSGSAVDSSKWSFDTGGNGWGNNELETYTSSTANAHLEGGNLVIKAIKERVTGTDGILGDY